MADTWLSGMHTAEGRRALAEVVLALFRKWELGEADQATLLGMGEVESLWQGAPLPNETDVLERAGLLLAIDRALKRQFAEQPWMQERWVGLPCVELKGRAPLQQMLEGVEGIRTVRDMLDRGEVV